MHLVIVEFDGEKVVVGEDDCTQIMIVFDNRFRSTGNNLEDVVDENEEYYILLFDIVALVVEEHTLVVVLCPSEDHIVVVDVSDFWEEEDYDQ
jgi:hypothetical protein